MRFVSDVNERFKGKSVVIIGSAPSCLDNKREHIESFDLIVRINNYKIKGFEKFVGERTDVFYSFFGYSIRKTAEELKSDGVTLCMCKCPNAKFIESDWHIKNHKPEGIDFRSIYRHRKSWWFCDTFIPTTEHFLNHFNLLNQHTPTTGFSCILDILPLGCEKVYITGFDFFVSKLHNVNEPWRPGIKSDPIGHVPRQEARWLKENVMNYPIQLDRKLCGLFL